jgi:hypothetical protein
MGKHSQDVSSGEARRFQNEFQTNLTHLVNGQTKGYKETFRAMLMSGAWRRKKAEILSKQYQQVTVLSVLSLGTPIEVEIPLYRGQNPNVLRMMAYLMAQLADDLLGAYVHGSLGSNEEIAYSDFDALVILSETVLCSPARLALTARRLAYAQTFMLEQDSLQHHGWFVLTPYDLEHFCDAYFPAVLFRYAKSLLSDKGQKLRLSPCDSTYDMRKSFDRLASSIIYNLESGNYRRNLYNLKGLLSQFMLLPSLYVQVRDGQGVWKGDSFQLARTDFDADLWAIMDYISAIRQNWSVSLTPLRRWKSRMPPVIVQKTRRLFGSHVPEPIGRLLNDRVSSSMKDLVHRMIERLG